MSVATRFYSLIVSNDFRRVGDSNLWMSFSTTLQGVFLNIDSAIECEIAQPTDVNAGTGWLFGDVPAGCTNPWVLIADARTDAGAHGDSEMVELIDIITGDYGHLTDYNSGEVIRPATEAERYSSIEAADIDGGAGVIEVDGIKCFVA